MAACSQSELSLVPGLPVCEQEMYPHFYLRARFVPGVTFSAFWV